MSASVALCYEEYTIKLFVVRSHLSSVSIYILS
jgi:hypothetical protein